MTKHTKIHTKLFSIEPISNGLWFECITSSAIWGLNIHLTLNLKAYEANVLNHFRTV